MNEWQSMDSAPKDGTRVLLWCFDEMEIGYWSTCCWVKPGGAWIIYENRSDTIELAPNFWQSLPDPPPHPTKNNR